MVRRLYADLGLADRLLPLAEIIAHVRRHPDLAALNAGVTQKHPAT
jgi:hypothetical protein